MKNSLLTAGALGVALALSPLASLHAAELKVLATGAHIDSFKEIVPQFERESGHKLTVKYDATPVAIKNIEAGEAFDVAVTKVRRSPGEHHRHVKENGGPTEN